MTEKRFIVEIIVSTEESNQIDLEILEERIPKLIDGLLWVNDKFKILIKQTN